MRLKNNPTAANQFLTKPGPGRELCRFLKGEPFFVQGGPTDCVFYLLVGRAKLTVVAHTGKTAIVSRIKAGDFLGEEAVALVPGHRMATATAITPCRAMKIHRPEMIQVVHGEGPVTERFLAFLLSRSMQVQADLVEQLFNSKERRLARILLLMAQFGQPGEPVPLIPHITQSRLAEMVGATAVEIKDFMQRFGDLGFIRDDGRILVDRSLLNIVLRDQDIGQNAVSTPLLQAKNL